MKKCFAEFKSNKNLNYETVYLYFSCLHFLSGNHCWFCRIWDKNWIDKIGRKFYKEYGESYGRNKFEAYRLAVKNLNN